MKESEYKNRVALICKFINSSETDDLVKELKTRGATNPFVYGVWCEKNFEQNLREDYERKTMFTNDFSIAEWCVGVGMDKITTISGTLQNALLSYKNNVEYFAELILVLNLKSWEHHARGNQKWSSLYSDLYYQVRNLYFDWFDDSHPKHDEAMRYYYDYID